MYQVIKFLFVAIFVLMAVANVEAAGVRGKQEERNQAERKLQGNMKAPVAPPTMPPTLPPATAAPTTAATGLHVGDEMWSCRTMGGCRQ